jgi:hypothetical protein
LAGFPDAFTTEDDGALGTGTALEEEGDLDERAGMAGAGQARRRQPVYIKPILINKVVPECHVFSGKMNLF